MKYRMHRFSHLETFEERLADHLLAEKHGLAGRRCDLLYPHCPLRLFDSWPLD